MERIAARTLRVFALLDPGKLAERLETEPSQDHEHIVVEPQRRHGQVGEAMHDVVPWRENAGSGPVMRQRPCRPRGRRDGRAHGQLAVGEPRGDIGQQPGLATEQVRHRTDIDQQAVGGIECGPRPPAPRPCGEMFEKLAISRRIGRSYLQGGIERARIGQHHAGPCPARPAGIVGRLDPRAMRGFRDQRERGGIGPFTRRAAVPQTPAIDREAGAPDRQDATRLGKGFRSHQPYTRSPSGDVGMKGVPEA